MPVDDQFPHPQTSQPYLRKPIRPAALYPFWWNAWARLGSEFPHPQTSQPYLRKPIRPASLYPFFWNDWIEGWSYDWIDWQPPVTEPYLRWSPNQYLFPYFFWNTSTEQEVVSEDRWHQPPTQPYLKRRYELSTWATTFDQYTSTVGQDGESAVVPEPMSGAGDFTRARVRGRAFLNASLTGMGALSYGFPYGRWFATGRGSATGTLQATGLLSASLSGSGSISDVLHGAWFAQGRGTLTGTLTGRLRGDYQHQIVRRYDLFTNKLTSALEKASGNAEIVVQQVIPANTTDLPLNVSFNASAVVMAGIFADKDVLLEVNDPNTPTATLNLSAGVPLIWSTQSLASAPFSGTVNNIYFTNSGPIGAPVTNFTLSLLLEE